MPGLYDILRRDARGLDCRSVSRYSGHMSTKTVEVKRGYDWEALEIEFMESPWIGSREFARERGIDPDTLSRYARPLDPEGWVQRRNEKYRKIHQANSERIAGILEENSNNDISSFKALEDRVKRLALASLELIVPPEDAPLEAQTAARTRLAEMNAKQLSEIVNQSLRTLTETGRHRRLLTGQATALFGRADAPDVLIDEPLESARVLEMRSRMAQKALRASLEGEPLDVEYALIPPNEEIAYVSSVPPDSPGIAYQSRDASDSPTLGGL